MSKLKKLTESDINRLVKKILTEDFHDEPSGPVEFVVRDIGCGEGQEIARYDIEMNSEKEKPQVYIEYCKGKEDVLQKLKDEAMKELQS